MKFYYFIAGFIILAASSVNASESKWSSSELFHYNLSLVSNTRILSFDFQNEKSVSAGIGKIDAPRTASILSWSIDKEGVLLIKQGPTTMMKIKKITQYGNRFTVLMSIENGPWETAEFQRKHIADQERKGP